MVVSLSVASVFPYDEKPVLVAKFCGPNLNFSLIFSLKMPKSKPFLLIFNVPQHIPRRKQKNL